MRPILKVLSVGLVLTAAASAAEAQDSPDPAATGGWSFVAAPYVWAAGLEGDVATLPGLPPAEVDASFADILENLDIGFMGGGEIRKGRFGFLVDLIYVDLSADASTRGPFFSGVEADVQSFIGTLEGLYRAVATENANLDLLAGARVWSVSTKLSLEAGLLPAQSREETETWVDPIIGVKGRMNLVSNLYLTAWGNVGGFGAASDITWDLFGGIGYQLSDWFAPVAGYRHLEVDYEKDGFLYDVEQSGPVIGGVFRF